MKKGSWAVCMVVGMMLFTACGDNTPKDETASTDASEQRGEAARVVEVTLSFVEPRFRPDPIEIKVGEPVQFKLSSADTRHRFIIEPLDIDVEVPPKSGNEPMTTKVVTPTETGKYRVFCSIHARMPMEGTIVVSQGDK